MKLKTILDRFDLQNNTYRYRQKLDLPLLVLNRPIATIWQSNHHMLGQSLESAEKTAIWIFLAWLLLVLLSEEKYLLLLCGI
jgi:hypothetical protein